MGASHSHHEIRGKYNLPKEGDPTRKWGNASPKQSSPAGVPTTLDGSAGSTSTSVSTWIHQGIDVTDAYELHEVIAYGHLGPVYICSRRRRQHSNHTGEFIMIDNVITRSERTDGSSSSSNSPSSTRGTYHRLYACKTISTCRLSNKTAAVSNLLHEISQIRDLPPHPNILSLSQVFINKRHLHLITELCTGGDLHSRIEWNTELDSAHVLEQMASALVFLHSHGMFHSNLKMENVLYEHAGSNAGIKLIDFGVSQTFGKCRKCRSVCGVEYAAAPASNNKKEECTPADNVWSMGVIAFYLLSGGTYPFGTDCVMDEKRHETATLEFGEEWQQRNVSEMGQTFCRSCLSRDPNERWTASDILEYIPEWIQIVETTCNVKPLANVPPPIVDVSLRGVQDFGLYGQGRKRLLYCLANTLDKSQLQQLQDILVDLDSSSSGTLTLEQVKMAVKQYRKQEKETCDLTKEDVKEMFKGCHQDPSGPIEYVAFLQAVLQLQGMLTHERLGEALDRADPEDKGLLEKEEMKRILGKDCDWNVLEPIMEEFQTDNDMVEYDAVLERLFQDPAKAMNHVRRIADPM